MNEALGGMQRGRAAMATAARNIARPAGSSGPELRPVDSLRDIVDLSKSAQTMKASAAVMSVATDMSDEVLALGRRLDRFA